MSSFGLHKLSAHLKCKAKKEMRDAKEITMKNDRKAMKGKCPDCGTGMFKILGKK
jgi:ssDNA-binding Zn-finger/Zn-ribbon topoisomerase 1